MDITPFIKALLDKQGEALSLHTGEPVKLTLNGEAKPISKVNLPLENVKQAALKLMNKEQIKTFQQDKKVSFEYRAPGFDERPLQATISLQKSGIHMDFTPQAAEAEEDDPIKKYAPPRFDDDPDPIDSHDLLDYLKIVIAHDASDLFVTSGSQVKTKLSGRAVPVSTFVTTPDISKKFAYGIMNEEQIEAFQETNDLDFAIAMPDGSARFRVNAFMQRRTVGLVLRLIPSEIPTAAQLNLPEILSEIIMLKRGLFLMVGGTGSGKSTTLAALINHRNENAPGHILTIEDPVEFSHPNKMSIVNQREVGVDTVSYATAIKASLREAPDVILIGEIRTAETMEAALELANTGHLCISTMHANNANQAMERIVNMFPVNKHKQLFMDMSANIRAVVSQRLIPDVRGKRVAAIEVMMNTPHIADLILKGALNDIKEAMAGSGAKGMKTFDNALYDLFREGKITMEEAVKNADSPNDLEGWINFGRPS